MDRRDFLKRAGVGFAALPLSSCVSSLVIKTNTQGTVARLRDLGVVIGSLVVGRHNAITDVPGVIVGHTTLISGNGPLVVGSGPVRTGVTAVLPHDRDLVSNPVPAADWTLNGNGELTGVGPVRRSGLLGAPILFTDTGSVGPVYDGCMQHLLLRHPNLYSQSIRPEPIVGETWADFLHDTAGGHVRPEHAIAAINTAKGGPVAEGCVGGGTGMRAYSFKAGIGTASRIVTLNTAEYTVGVLVQSNHGRRPQLRVDGVPVGQHIPDLLPESGNVPGSSGHSLLIAIATDAPLMPLQLKRLCKRATIGMAHTGGISTHGSGDLFIAFSTALDRGRVVHFSHLDRLYQAVVEATEESILNSLIAAETVVGRDDNTIHALPLDRFVAVMRRHGRIK